MQHGVQPVRPDSRDYDFHKTFAAKVGSLGIFPDSFSTDAGLTMPDQEYQNDQFTPPVPPLPNGCTDYCSSELCIDEDKKLYNPIDIENVTHANAEGGCDVRVSLAAALSVYRREAYFNIAQANGADFFDSFRAAIYAASRSISLVTPWYKEWQQNGPSSGLLLQPTNTLAVTTPDGALPWHNHKLCGWETINGEPVLTDKSWQGNIIGNKGFLYLNRSTINAVMELSGTGAFTLAPTQGATIQTVEIGLYEKVLADVEEILKLY